MQRRNHDEVSSVVVLTHDSLPPITLTFTLEWAGRLLADAHSVAQSLPQNAITLQGVKHPFVETREKVRG